ncbi:MAG: polymer-forming cytoskeletal protein [Ruminococcus sp.]|nr:polymer-forming cytoskeletal protein [Ruminococcus sp.]
MRTEKKRSFKGAVLITVVSVMSLLIVFLTSTLILASAANNRAHKSYSSSQANYTARTAIDSILKAASEDDDFATAIASLTTGTGFDVDITMESTAAGMGRVTKARVEYAGSRDYYDSSEKEWVSKDLISITADVLYGGETKTVTAYVLKNPPTSVNNPGGGGGFVTVGSAVVSNHTNSFGGTYLGIGMASANRMYQYNNPAIPFPFDDVSLEQKLYLNVKDGVSYEYDADGRPFYAPENNDIMVGFTTGNDQTIEAPFVVNGNLTVNTQTHVYFPTKGSGMAVWGNMDIQNSSFQVFSETVSNDKAVLFNQEITKFQDIPYIYVDSLLKLNNQTIGNGNLPLNIFCGSFEATSNDTNTYANIYCQDSNKTSYLGSNNTALHAWSNSVLNGTSSYLGTCTSGNFYTKGNLEVKNKGAAIDGDLVVEGDLIINLENSAFALNVTGSVVVNGTLRVVNGTINASNGIYATSATGQDVTTTSTKKMAANGIDELYERQDNITYYVLAKNVTINHISWGNQEIFHDYVWLNPDVISSYGLPVGTTFVDMNGGAVIDETFVNEIVNSGIDASNETTITKEHSVNTIWVNRDDPTDTTTNEMDTFEAGGTFAYKGTNLGTPDLYAATHNNELFPKQAEKAVILGIEEIGDGTPKETSKVVQTIDEIEQSYNFKNAAVTDVPVDNGIRMAVESNVYDSSNVPDEITESCTLEGGFGSRIYIKNESSNDIWVKLKNFSMSPVGSVPADFGIVYDDSAPNCGKLILFVEGNVTFDKANIVTKSYWDLISSKTPFQIATNDDLYISGVTKVTSPKIKIYSEEADYDGSGNLISRPSLRFWNFDGNPHRIVTAMIEAPNLDFYIQKAEKLDFDMYYDAINIKDRVGDSKAVGLIGVLNVAQADGQNEWTFLYTPDASSLPPSMPHTPHGADSFIITYYEGF